MIELTAEQHKAISQNGVEPVRVLDRVTNTEYVLVRGEVYERLVSLLSDELPHTAALMNEVMAEDDMHDPYLDGYQALGRQTEEVQ